MQSSVIAELIVKKSGLLADLIVNSAYFVSRKTLSIGMHVIIPLSTCFSIVPVLVFLIFLRIISLLIAVLAAILISLGFHNGLIFKLLTAAHFYAKNLNKLRAYCALSMPVLEIVFLPLIWILMMALSIIDGFNTFIYRGIERKYANKCADSQEARGVFFLIVCLFSLPTVMDTPTECVKKLLPNYFNIYKEYYILALILTFIVLIYAFYFIQYLIETTDTVEVHNKTKDKKYIYERALLIFDLHTILVEKFATLFSMTVGLVGAVCLWCVSVYRMAKSRFSGI
ncbi:uncharacterized protein VICG_01442 [Vittaforma corneae ATCC 50505]|uniref:Uncharacterized protein n=1 Tax=Vittaforma corneae (strain ATCC 50505) TaxID=993615 RepID=L2GL21_VITCO|nr:uncharacterized protein VICG_01442 [Vittaforma corneae ATCC 50505]ELA41578.1 hypothetical protein VICG_01442 [Vittaforma corneae ATCC 50505]